MGGSIIGNNQKKAPLLSRRRTRRATIEEDALKVIQHIIKIIIMIVIKLDDNLFSLSCTVIFINEGGER